MAPDLLSTIRCEIDERLSELHPLLAEYEQLLVAVDALLATGGGGGSATAVAATAPVKRVARRSQTRPGRRGSAAGAIERVAVDATTAAIDRPEAEESAKSPATVDGPRKAKAPSSSAKPKPERAARGAARDAILAALDHGSHTVGELAVVTAMSGPSINGNLRKLLSAGAVVKTEREGKAAWALADAAI
ncbi:MAG: hypothetical protein WAN93_08685 [Solirubrobacteraceae bacterium]